MASKSQYSDTASLNRFIIPQTGPPQIIMEFDTDESRPGLTRLTVPHSSTWTPSPHWHERYTEYLKVLQGRVTVVLDGQTRVVTADDGPQVVDKFVVHEWYRADRGSDQKDEGDVIVEEWTDPADGLKQVFFRNLLSMYIDKDRFTKLWLALRFLVVCYAYDNFEPLLPGPRVLGFLATRIVAKLITVVAVTFGLRAWQEEYTPEKLRAVAEKERHI